VLALLAVCLGVPQVARSAPVLDQAFVPVYLGQPDVVFGTMYASLGMGLRAQTFTVGLTGVLTSFDVLLDTTGLGAGERTFDILGTIGGVPDVASAPLASVTIPFAGDSTGFYAGSLGVPLPVGAGGVFAIADRGLQGDGAYWVGHYDYADDPAFSALLSHYAGGAAYGPTFTEPVGLFGGDLGFRTYVDPDSAQPPSIPEPATLLLLGTGMALALVSRRR
jgi:hypothetical protein